MKEESQGEEVDIFRDTPLRYLGYANELGESFRSVVNVKWVVLSYGVASSYVLADTISKSNKVRKELEKQPGQIKRTLATAADVLLWQSFASVIIPGFVINRICAGTAFLLKRTPMKKTPAKWATVLAGLASIPLIIHPIDHSVTYAMDNTIRRLIHPKKSQ